jgi:hypothetical protein
MYFITHHITIWIAKRGKKERLISSKISTSYENTNEERFRVNFNLMQTNRPYKISHT